MDQDLTYRLGETVLDLSRGTLRKAGKVVTLRPNTLKLLGYLVHNAGRVATKDELLDAVWPATVVTEDSLTQCVRDARKSIGDEEHEIIRTVSRRGYIYEAPAGAKTDLGLTLAQLPRDLGLDLLDPEPKIAVLPFRLGGTSEVTKSNFAMMTKAIVRALSTSPAVAVCSPSQATRAVALNAGADYLVEGEVDSIAAYFKIVITLSETSSDRRLLTQTFFLKAESVPMFQQAVARQVVNALVFNIETSAWQRTPEGTNVTHRW